MAAKPNTKNQKSWSGRFEKAMAEELINFNASIDFDRRLAGEDVAGSIAQCKMLKGIGLLTAAEEKSLLKALKQIGEEILQDKFVFQKSDEDIHMNIERRLVELTGDTGRKIHTGRSRNDQVALDTRLYARKAIDQSVEAIKSLQRILLIQADKQRDTLLPGYTHLQRGQPVSLAHHLLAYFEMLERDRTRFNEIRRRVDVMPLGSGALAGSTLPLDREAIRKELGFAEITANSLDAVSDRDYVIEILSAGSILMMHLSRFSEEWVLWSTKEFGFIEIDESLCTGSSMMPQKKNPDLPELVRGKCARVYGNLMTVLALTKSLPLAYNKDLQEDKEPLFDTVDTLLTCLSITGKIIEGTTFNAERMRDAAGEPLILATDLAEYLVQKGIPFRTAHEIVGKTVRYCIEKKKGLADLTLAELRKFADSGATSIDNSIFDIFNLDKAVDRRSLPGGTGRTAIAQALKDAKARLNR